MSQTKITIDQIKLHALIVDKNHNMESVIDAYAAIARRLDRWNDQDNEKVTDFRSNYDLTLKDVLGEMRAAKLADEKTAPRYYDLKNTPSPVLDILNWPLYVKAKYDDLGEEIAISWMEGSTVQAPIHMLIEERGFASSYVNIKPLNNGQGGSKTLPTNDKEADAYLTDHALINILLDDAIGGTFPIICIHGKEAFEFINKKIKVIANITEAIPALAVEQTGFPLDVGGGATFAGVYIAKVGETPILVFSTCKFCLLFRRLGVDGIRAMLREEAAPSNFYVREAQPIIAYWYFRLWVCHEDAMPKAKEILEIKTNSSILKSIALSLCKAGGQTTFDNSEQLSYLMHTLEKGIFDDANIDAVRAGHIKGGIKGGKSSYENSEQLSYLMHTLEKGIFDDANIDAVRAGHIKGGIKGGKSSYENSEQLSYLMHTLEKGIFDDANIDAVRAGNSKGGQSSFENSEQLSYLMHTLEKGMFDEINKDAAKAGISKGGQSSFENSEQLSYLMHTIEKGLFDVANKDAMVAGRSKGGINPLKPRRGMSRGYAADAISNVVLEREKAPGQDTAQQTKSIADTSIQCEEFQSLDLYLDHNG